MRECGEIVACLTKRFRQFSNFVVRAFWNAGTPAIDHRRWDKHMVREGSNSLSASENNQGRQFGHLRLLTSEAHHGRRQPRNRTTTRESNGGSRAGSVTSERYMPKRQHQDNRKYNIDETRAADASQAESSTTPIIKREFMLTPGADDTLYQAVRTLSRATGTNLSNSHFLRVMLKVVADAMPQIEEEALRLGKLKRPGNAPANQPEREEYEQRIAAAVGAAIATAASPKSK